MSTPKAIENSKPLSKAEQHEAFARTVAYMFDASHGDPAKLWRTIEWKAVLPARLYALLGVSKADVARIEAKVQGRITAGMNALVAQYGHCKTSDYAAMATACRSLRTGRALAEYVQGAVEQALAGQSIVQPGKAKPVAAAFDVPADFVAAE